MEHQIDKRKGITIDVEDASLDKLCQCSNSTIKAGSESEAIPREIMSLANTHHIFEMKTLTYFAHETYVSFTVSNLIESNVAKEDCAMGVKRTRDGTISTDALPAAKSVCVEQVTQSGNVLDDVKEGILAEDTLHGGKEENIHEDTD